MRTAAAVVTGLSWCVCDVTWSHCPLLLRMRDFDWVTGRASSYSAPFYLPMISENVFLAIEGEKYLWGHIDVAKVRWVGPDKDMSQQGVSHSLPDATGSPGCLGSGHRGHH